MGLGGYDDRNKTIEQDRLHERGLTWRCSYHTDQERMWEKVAARTKVSEQKKAATSNVRKKSSDAYKPLFCKYCGKMFGYATAGKPKADLCPDCSYEQRLRKKGLGA